MLAAEMRATFDGLLRHRGEDLDSPSCGAAWSAWEEFCREPLADQPPPAVDSLFFEAGPATLPDDKPVVLASFERGAKFFAGGGDEELGVVLSMGFFFARLASDPLQHQSAEGSGATSIMPGEASVEAFLAEARQLSSFSSLFLGTRDPLLVTCSFYDARDER